MHNLYIKENDKFHTQYNFILTKLTAKTKSFFSKASFRQIHSVNRSSNENKWKHKQLPVMQLSFTTSWVAWNSSYTKIIRLSD